MRSLGRWAGLATVVLCAIVAALFAFVSCAATAGQGATPDPAPAPWDPAATLEFTQGAAVKGRIGTLWDGKFYISFNAWFDPDEGWHRDDAAAGSSMEIWTTGGPIKNYYNSPAGTDPIVWRDRMQLGGDDNTMGGNLLLVGGELTWRGQGEGYGCSHLYALHQGGIASDCRIASLASVEAPEGKFGNIDAALAALNARIDAIQVPPAAPEPDLSGVYGALDQLRSRINSLPSPPPDVSGDVAELTAQLAAVQERHEELVDALLEALQPVETSEQPLAAE